MPPLTPTMNEEFTFDPSLPYNHKDPKDSLFMEMFPRKSKIENCSITGLPEHSYEISGSRATQITVRTSKAQGKEDIAKLSFRRAEGGARSHFLLWMPCVTEAPIPADAFLSHPDTSLHFSSPVRFMVAAGRLFNITWNKACNGYEVREGSDFVHGSCIAGILYNYTEAFVTIVIHPSRQDAVLARACVVATILLQLRTEKILY